MKLDYNEIVKEFNIDGLTLRKITNKFVKENFSKELEDLRILMEHEVDNSKLEFGNEPEIINQTIIPLTDLLMGHEMPTDIWLNFIRNSINGEFVKSVRDPRGIMLVSYDKTKVKSEAEDFSSQIKNIPEKDLIQGIKLALKEKIKNNPSL